MEKQQNTDQDQTESITVTESREVTLWLLQLIKKTVKELTVVIKQSITLIN